LDLRAAQAYAHLVGSMAKECSPQRSLVAAGNPSSSYLLDKLSGRNLCHGDPMPLGGPMLSPSALEAITQWISEGAPNN
jgi:hypothetical protein